MLSLLIPFAFAATTTFSLATSTVGLGNVQAVNYATSVFEGTPLMSVLTCESTKRHWDENGNVLRGRVNPADVGIMQINEKYHSAEAEKLGYDLLSAEGNILFARHLYEKKGLQPWEASSPCWKALVTDS